MKKTLLLATTAAAFAVGAVAMTPNQAQAQGLEASVNGFYNTLGIARDQDGGFRTENPRSYDINSRGRYNINAAYTLDNGITVGFQSQHEIQANMNTDRAFAYLRGGFGQIQMGNHQSVGYQMHTAVGGAGWGIDDTAHTNRIVEPQATTTTTIQTMAFGSGAAGAGTDQSGGLVGTGNNTYIQPRINYFTPRIAGFQLGVSFTPDNTRGPSGQRYVTDKAAFLGDDIEDIITAAANYSNTFGAFDVSGSIAGEWGEVSDTGAGLLDDDHEVYSGGLAVGFGGFEASAAYAWRNMATDRGNRHDVGAALTYSTGPWTVGPSFGYVRDKSLRGLTAGGAEIGTEKLWIYELGANYAMGPGVNLRGSAMYVDWDSNVGDRTGDGIGVGAGLALSF